MKKTPLVSTDYAYQSRDTGHWWRHGDSVRGSITYTGTSFAEALKTPRRYDIDETRILVVTVRCRALSTRTKASKKRTR